MMAIFIRTERSKEILLQINLDAKVISKHQLCGRIFDKDFSGFIDAYAVFLKINGPIPLKYIASHDGIWDGESECVIYKWK